MYAPVGSPFMLPTWTTVTSTPYVLSATNGVLSSNASAIYQAVVNDS